MRRTGVEAGAREADLVFPRLGEISGRVLTADGSPVRAYRLFVEGGDGLDRPFAAIGSPEGRFLVEGLGAGDYRVRAVAPDGHGKANVELGAGEHRAAIEITIVPCTSLAGRLVHETGKPLTEWWVGAIDPAADPSFILVTPVQRDGSFHFKNVPAREMAIKATQRQPEGPKPRELIERAPTLQLLTPKQGETTDLGDVVVTDRGGMSTGMVVGPEPRTLQLCA